MLNGPREERTHAAARAGLPMTAANVRSVIDELEACNKSKSARRSMAENAIKIAAISGKTTADGVAVWREYLATFNS